MKKASIVLFVLFVAAITNSFAQTATPPAATPSVAPPVATPASVTTPTAIVTPATADFFAGKWEVLMIGIPDGDKKFIASFTRKDGKLTGDLSDPTDAKAAKVPFTSIEEEADKITLAFSAQGYDLTLPLEKVDADNLKGQLMGMFETKAVRMK